MSLIGVITLNILFGSILTPIFIKVVASLDKRVTRFWWQYFFASTFMVAIAYYQNGLVLSWYTWPILLMGVINASACYAYWCAVDISQTKCSFFVQFQEILAIGLAVIFLGESHYLSLPVIIAILLTVGGTMSLVRFHKTDEALTSELKLLGYIVFFVVGWAAIIFSMKVFVTQGKPLNTFLAFFYLGSFLGASIIMVACQSNPIEISYKGILGGGGLAVLVVGGSYTGMWAYQLAPLVLVQPILQSSRFLGNLTVGLFVFNEGHEFEPYHWWSGGTALVGSLMLIWCTLG